MKFRPWSFQIYLWKLLVVGCFFYGLDMISYSGEFLIFLTISVITYPFPRILAKHDEDIYVETTSLSKQVNNEVVF